MSSITMIKKQMNIHGTWKAGYKISDALIKLIAAEVTTTPSKSGTVCLSPSFLTIELFPNLDGKPRTTNQLPFDSIRDISINPFNRKCLMIVYLDGNKKFSVMACSSQHEKDIFDFSKAFKDHKNLRLQNSRSESLPQNSPNWTLQRLQRIPLNEHTKIVQERYLTSSTPIGVSSMQDSIIPNGGGLMKHQLGTSQRSNASYSSRIMSGGYNDSDDVFQEGHTIVEHDPEDIVRQHAGWTVQGRHETFSVAIQTVPYTDDYDSESLTSASALQPGNISDANFPQEKFTEISSDVFHTRNNSQWVSVIKLNASENQKEQHDGSVEEDAHGQNHTHSIDLRHLAINGNDNGTDKASDKKGYDLRSCGAQTINSSFLNRRYTKRIVNRTTSNSYRERAEAARKGSSGIGPKSPTTDVPDSPVKADGVPPSSRSSVVSGSQRKNAFGQSSALTTSVKRTHSLGNSTVIKPIEEVYLGRPMWRSNSARSQRPIIIYPPSPYRMQ